MFLKLRHTFFVFAKEHPLTVKNGVCELAHPVAGNHHFYKVFALRKSRR